VTKSSQIIRCAKYLNGHREESEAGAYAKAEILTLSLFHYVPYKMASFDAIFKNFASWAISNCFRVLKCCQELFMTVSDGCLCHRIFLGSSMPRKSIKNLMSQNLEKMSNIAQNESGLKLCFDRRPKWCRRWCFEFKVMPKWCLVMPKWCPW